MDSPPSVVSPFKSSPVVAAEGLKSDFFVRSSGYLSRGTEVHSKDAMVGELEGFIGILEIYIHHARDIHNICIYQKQDVYAKLCLTSDPENTVSTQIINGGGKNPVFNQSLRLNVRAIDSSLKCEIWMLSRVKNYLEDQLLGFALVPLSEVFMRDGKNEFALSSTDMFHSPAGFVELSLSYTGASPEVMAIPAFPTPKAKNAAGQDRELSESVPSDFDNVEFPDPKIMNENQIMVSEYFGISCTNMDSQSSESLVTSDTENPHSSEMGDQVVQPYSTATVESVQLLKQDSPPSSVSTNGSPSALLPASSQSACDTPRDSESPNQEHVSPLKKKTAEDGNGESDSSGEVPSNAIAKPVASVNIEPEQNVVQQDIVDMYMKSMQQFTDSLAKMKLPLDIENGSPNSGNSSSDQKLQTPKNSGSRVFYGSRAFF